MSEKLSKPIRVILADDHEIFRDGFRTMLKKQSDIVLVGEAENGAELVHMASRLLPDVVITDIKMPKMDGIEATKKLHKKYPDMGIIAFTMFDEDSLIVDMMEAGTSGYLLKNTSKTEIYEAIKTVYKKETYYCQSTTVKLAKMMGKSKFTAGVKKKNVVFSDRELETVYYICKELSNKEIAAAMSLSVRTIEDYRGKIQDKMDVRNTAGLVIYAVRHGLFII